MRIIGLTGKKRVGKDTVARILCEQLDLVQIAFADPIREMLSALPIPEQYKENKLAPIPELRGRTYTDLMQTLGTDWGRNMIYHTIWVDMAEQARLRIPKDKAGVVFSDVRYVEEARYISRIGGAIYAVEGPRGVVANTHSSEEGLPTNHISGSIPNYGTLGELHAFCVDMFC